LKHLLRLNELGLSTLHAIPVHLSQFFRNETGRKGGRQRKDDDDAAKARQLRNKGISATDIAKMLGVSRATVYRYLSEAPPLSA
jgi:hypothetical protein